MKRKAREIRPLCALQALVNTPLDEKTSETQRARVPRAEYAQHMMVRERVVQAANVVDDRATVAT